MKNGRKIERKKAKISRKKERNIRMKKGEKDIEKKKEKMQEERRDFLRANRMGERERERGINRNGIERKEG